LKAERVFFFLKKKEAKKTLFLLHSTSGGQSRTIREVWIDARNNLLANPKFQAFAAKFPLTRPIAQREARALFDLCAGFVYAQILSACVDLKLFESLAQTPRTAESLAMNCKMPAEKLDILLAAAASLRLLEKTGEKYRLGPLGAALRGNPGLPAMIAHHKLFYADMADPVALLRGQTSPALAKFWPYQGAGDSQKYSAIMAATQTMVAAEILAAYDFGRHKTVLDAGGGTGAFLSALHQKHPHIERHLFDLPDVVASAKPGITAHGGDLLGADLPTGADLITLIRVLHDHSDESALKILRNVRAALPPGGTLLVAEPLAGTKGAEPVGTAYFGFYLLAMGSGRPRTGAQLRALLSAAGFKNITQPRTAQPLITSVLLAKAA
jgi:demethylspheroidene O-methyltransferase